ncbi:MAG: CotH kinase family protein [Lachnospiraceae bacterium]|nr:CotH kinase family protein [Lachnospiraceae bacterium]
MLKKYRIRWLVFMISLAASFFICIFLNDMRQETDEPVSMEEKAEKGLYVSVYAADGGRGYEISPWYAGEEGKYLLFLPDWAVQISFSRDILLDGKELAKEEKINIDTEQFSFICEGQAYQMETVELSQLPTLYIDTETGNLDALKLDKDYEEAMELYALGVSGNLEEQSAGWIHCRGNVTFEMAEKKSYAIEFTQKVDLYEEGGAIKWVLLANYFDSTSMRNYLTFYMAEQMNLYGTPEAQWVDLFANGEYQGIYLLCEKVEIGEERLNINNLETALYAENDLEAVKQSAFYKIAGDGQSVVQKGFRLEKEPEDISGGYLLELEAMPERYAEGKSGFISDRGQQVVIESPKYASVAQVRYISGLYQELEDALCSGDETAQEAFLEYADLDSFVRKYLIEEFSKNVDASMSSCFIYKPEDAVSTKLYAGPVWDYDRAYGNMSNLGEGLDMRTPEGLFVRDGWYGTPFWSYFCMNPVFQENVQIVFEEEMLPLIDECIWEEIPQWEELIRTSVYADLRRWPNKEETVNNFQGLSYEEKVDKMIEFMTARTAYLKQEWGCE